MNNGSTMMQRFAYGVLARGFGRSCGLLMATVLVLAGLGSQAQAAPSYYPTSGIDLKQFSPKKFSPTRNLNEYWMYLDSTLNTGGTGWSSANRGLIGIGSNITTGSNEVRFKIPTYVGGNVNANANTYFDTTVHVEGNALFSQLTSGIGVKGGASVAQFDGNLLFSQNGGTVNAPIWVKKVLTPASNPTFNKEVHIGGTLASTNANFLDKVYFSSASGVGEVGLPVGKAVMNNPYNPPMGNMEKFDSSQLPAYNVPGLGSAYVNSLGERINISNKNYETNVCNLVGVNCLNVPAQTFNGVSLPAGKALPPGYYGRLNISTGTTVYLMEGVYYFNSVDMRNAGDQLIAIQSNGGRTIVYADSGFRTWSGNIFVGPLGAVGATGYGSGPNLFLGGTMMVAAGPHAGIRFDSDAKIWATLSAPTDTIRVNSGLKLFGQMFARHFYSANTFSGGEGNGDFVPFDPEKPKITIATAGMTVPEKDTTYTLTVSIPSKNAYDVAFKYATSVSVTAADGTTLIGSAIPGKNYLDQSASAIATIKAGETSVKIPITIKWDSVYTGNLTFYLDFTEPAGGVFAFDPASGVIGDTSHVAALITILDKDRAPAFRISDVSAKEGNSGPTAFKFVVSFADAATGGPYLGTVGRDISFPWQTSFGTASADAGDYTGVSIGSKYGVILKGKTTDTLVVQVNGDRKFEADETFKVLIPADSLFGKSAFGAVGNKLEATGTILNDDSLPQLKIDNIGFVEGSADSVRKLVVYLVDPVRVDAENKPLKLDATSAPQVPVKYSWSTSDLTAGHSLTGTVKDTDYVEVLSTRDSIPAGSWTDTILVTIQGDEKREADETFQVTLVPLDSAWKKAGNAVATDTIRNDDALPVVKITADSSGEVLEGPKGVRKAVTFTVGLYDPKSPSNLLKPADAPAISVYFDWSMVNGTAIGKDSGSSDTDFVVVTGRRDSVKAGSVSTILVDTVYGDNRYELDEYFTGALTNLVNASATGNVVSANLTILNDDSLPRLKVTADNGGKVAEGKSGDRNKATFTVALTDAAGNALTSGDAPAVPVSFTWKTVNDTAKASGSGVADSDFVAVTNLPVTISADSLTSSLEVAIKGDDIDEAAKEWFHVALTPGTNASSNGTLIAYDTIVDDDDAPTLALTGASKLEGNSASSPFYTRFTLSSISALPVTFNWFTKSGTATTNVDYQERTSVSKTIAAGSTTDSVAVTVNGDKKLEADETYLVAVDSASLTNATFKNLKEIANFIRNDDARPKLVITDASVTEGNAGNTAMTFTVSLQDSTSGLALTVSDAPNMPVTFTWQTADSSATAADNDYVAQPPKLDSIKAGQVSTQITVQVKGDTRYELADLLKVLLSAADYATFQDSIGVGTILDDDAIPTLSIDSVSVTEPANASSPDASLSFTVTLSAAAGIPVSVKASTEDLTATGDNGATKFDYIPQSNATVTFNPDVTSQTFTVKVHGDLLFEGTVPESLLVRLSAAVNAQIKAGTGLGLILDQDPAPSIKVDTVTVNEGAAATFKISLSSASALPVYFRWATASRTAIGGLDYTTIAPTLDTIEAGQSQVTVSVPTLTDNVANESLEDFHLVLTNVVNATSKDSGLGRITDVTPKPAISVNDTIAPESAGTMTFRVKLDKPSAAPLSLRWGTIENADVVPVLRAIVNTHYNSVSGFPLVIPAGVTDTVIKVTVIDNPQDDADSIYYKVRLLKNTASDPSFTFKDSVGVGIILDNDAPPTVSISNNINKQEPADSGNKAWLKVTVSLSEMSGRIVTVKWSTRDSTAKHDSDFVAVTNRTITFTPGVQSVDDSVAILGDNLFEGYEYFKVYLTNPVYSTLKDSVGKATITDNDPAPGLSIGDVVVREPSIDSTNPSVVQTLVVKVPVRLDRPSAKDVTFNWIAVDSTALGGIDAASGKDYVNGSGTATIKAGDSLVYLPVTILSDNLSNEGLEVGNDRIEYLKVSISDFNGMASAPDTLGLVSIKDANGNPSLTIDSLSAFEADSIVTFHVKLSNPSAKAITVAYTTVPLTATSAKDFVATTGTLNIPALATTATIPVTLMEDLLDENAEEFRLVLSNGTDVNLVDSIGLGTILDDDNAPSISVRDTALLEPSDSGVVATLIQTFRLSAPSGLDVTALWEARDLSVGVGHAKVGEDYLTAGGTVRFAAGEVLYRDTVKILGDKVYEKSETFEVLLSSPTNATLQDSIAIDTILDADLAPALHIDSAVVKEGELAVFTVRLDGESGLPASFQWHSVAGSAIAGLDYRDTTGSVVIPAGSLTATLAVRTLVDALSGEGTETFLVRLNSLDGASGSDTIGLGRILDTNALPALGVDSIKVTEADTTIFFTVTMAGQSAVDVRVGYKTVEGTAAAGVRYVDTTGVLVIPAGQTSGKIAVRILNDEIREPLPETFTLVLGPVDSARLARPIGLGTIVDDNDNTPIDIFSADTVREGEDAVFAVKVLGQTKDTARVYWHTVAGGAKSDTDFVSQSGVVTFLPGQSQKSIVITTLKDSIWEPVENYFIRIDSITKGSFADTADTLVQAWIADALGAPSVTFLSPDTTVQEDVSDSVLVRIGLSWQASVDVKVLVPRQVGTALFGSDYTESGLVSDTLVFKAGAKVATFKVHVVKDSTDEYDETAAWLLLANDSIKVGAKSRYELTVQDDDSAPMVRVVKDTQHVTEGGEATVAFKLSRKSAKEITAWYTTSGTATPGLDHDLIEGLRGAILFPAGTDTASTVLKTLEDKIHEPTETAVYALDGAVNASLDSLHRIDSVFLFDNDNVPTVRFVKPDTTVLESVGAVTFTLTLSNPSAFATHVTIRAKPGTATLDSAARISDAVLDTLTAYPVVFAAGDTVATFTLSILDDGRVEPTETFFLKLVSNEAIAGDSATVRILDNDKLPVVKITDPTEGERLGKKDLTLDGKVPAKWLVDGVPQVPFDTLVAEGPATISKCYTDEWGNTGCDSVHVIVDTTAPKVIIQEYSTDSGKTWIKVVPGTVPSVNNPDVLLKWISIDGTDTTKHQDPERLKDSLNTPVRCAEDAVGNRGCGTTKIVLDTIPPKVDIQTPPDGSSFSAGCINMVWVEMDGDVVIRHDSLLCLKEVGPYKILVQSKPDAAGNVGWDSVTINILPNAPTDAIYIDSDNDGRIDQVVLQFPRAWTDSLPVFDISYGAPGANTQKGLTASFGTASQAGTTMVVNGQTVRVIAGSAVLDAQGQQVILADGTPLFQAPALAGSPLLDSAGRQRTNAQGVPLWKITADAGAVDSSVLVVKLAKPFPYGWTSSSLTDLGILKASITVRSLDGTLSKQPMLDTFDIKDGVAPVILGSKITMTEDYNGKDTLVIQLSEAADIGKSSGIGVFEISKDGGKTWISVNADSISATGTLKIVLEPGEPGTPRPGVLIRIAGNVTDPSGNAAGSLTSPPVMVTGAPRPDMVVAKGPTSLLEVTADHANFKLSGPMTFLASKGGSGTSAYKPGEGYVSGEETRSVCPDLKLCAATSLYINRPASIEMFIYDHLGTYVAKTSFFVTAKDLAQIEKDKLDRARLQILWNLRDMNNRQVATGVYLVRMLIRYTDESKIDAKMENYILRYGVKVR